ncbi:hypothetical protein RQP46_011503 [Phenoliferia psychrophenolica]
MSLVTLPLGTPHEDIFNVIRRDGGVIISNFMSPEQLEVLNSGAQPIFDRLKVTPDLASLPELGLDFYAGKMPQETSLIIQHDLWDAIMHETLKTTSSTWIGDKLFTIESSYVLSVASAYRVAPGGIGSYGAGIGALLARCQDFLRPEESYHINLIAFGGSIGTALFVYIDDAAGFALGWNFWGNEIALVAFEVTAFTVVLEYWADTMKVNVAVYVTLILIAYFLINIWSTRHFGNAEFLFSIGKILLISGLLLMTFITMLGGNPIHDRFGFRFWRNPGAMTTPYPSHAKGTGLFEGFLAAVSNAAFTIAGPDYLTMVAGETRNPRKSLPIAFKKTVYRLVVFFIGNTACLPHRSGKWLIFTELLNAIGTGAKGAAKSPYVIAMRRLKIRALPSIVNGLILSSIFSAGNAYYFSAARALAQMSRDGHAPSFLAKRNRNGVPYLAVIVSGILSFLSYCQVSSSAQIAISWLSGIVTACQLLNWVLFSFTWICWNRAMKVQGVSRSTLPVTSWIMPYGAWWAFISGVFVLFMQGYYVFLKGAWSVDNFLFSYLAPIVFVFLFLAWKLLKRTTWIRAKDVDLVSHLDDPAFDQTFYDDEARGKIGTAVHKTLQTLF